MRLDHLLSKEIPLILYKSNLLYLNCLTKIDELYTHLFFIADHGPIAQLVRAHA